MTVPDSMACSVCTGESGSRAKYKCPVCRAPYCSAACCQIHKERDCNNVEPEPEAAARAEVPQPVRYFFPTEDTVPLDRLERLQQDDELRQILSNPELRATLESIDSSQQPERAVGEAMAQKDFETFVNRCLQLIEGSVNDEEGESD